MGFIKSIVAKLRNSASFKDGDHAVKNNAETNNFMENTSPIDTVANVLRIMGYNLTTYGAGVALLEIESGYNEVETASHIALTTMALDIREAGKDIAELLSLSGAHKNIIRTFVPQTTTPPLHLDH